MQKSQAITNYSPTVATLSESLSAWCNKDLDNSKKEKVDESQVAKKVELSAEDEISEVSTQERREFDPVDSWVKSMCVQLVQSGAYKNDPEFCKELLIRKAKYLYGVIAESEASAQANLRKS